PRGSDLVADAPDRDDRRGLSELPPELADVHVHRAGVAGERVAPDALEELVPSQDEAAMVEQLPEKVELLRSELNLLAVHPHLAAARVDVERAVLELLLLRLAPVGQRSAQDRLHACDELAGVERLRQVVVGADLEA